MASPVVVSPAVVEAPGLVKTIGVNMGRILGIILIAGGIIVGIIITALMMVYRGEGSLTPGAATLGWVIRYRYFGSTTARNWRIPVVER